MKRFTTILCGIAFAIFGIGLGLYGIKVDKLSHAQTAAAGETMLKYKPLTDIHYSQLPRDLQLDLAKNAPTAEALITNAVDSAIVDSLNNVITQLKQKEPVTKVRWMRGPAPPPIVKTKVVELHTTDTVHVPVYYLATRVDKEGSTGQCTPIYEVRKVDEICPQVINSSDSYVNEHNSSAGD